MQSLIDFFDNYPFWIRSMFAAWVVFGVILFLCVFLMRRSVLSKEPTITTVRSDLQNKTSGEFDYKGLINNGYACLVSIQDSKGNLNRNSWAKNLGGDWSNPNDTSVNIDEQIEFIVEAIVTGDSILEYQFAVQRSGGSFVTKQNWSNIHQWTWRIEKEDIGKNVVVKVSVRNPKDYYRYHDADDYTYATYDILP